MRKNTFAIFAISIITILSSCASIPRESIDMSANLDRQLTLLKSANESLIDSIYTYREQRVIEYLDSIWFPQYVDNLFATESASTLWNMALESDDTMTRMEVMQLITKEAMYRYKAEMEMMIQPIMEEREAVKNAFGTEFDNASEMNATLGRFLSSHYDVQSSYMTMLPEGKAEQLDSILRTSVLKLDQKLHKAKENKEIITNTIVTVKNNF